MKLLSRQLVINRIAKLLFYFQFSNQTQIPIALFKFSVIFFNMGKISVTNTLVLEPFCLRAVWCQTETAKFSFCSRLFYQVVNVTVTSFPSIAEWIKFVNKGTTVLPYVIYCIIQDSILESSVVLFVQQYIRISTQNV